MTGDLDTKLCTTCLCPVGVGYTPYVIIHDNFKCYHCLKEEGTKPKPQEAKPKDKVKTPDLLPECHNDKPVDGERAFDILKGMIR